MTTKDRLLQKCTEFVSQKIKTIEHSILELRLAANSETKSSVGDKYETGRAMIQLEIEKNAIKVNNALDYQTNIDGIYAIGDVNIYPGKLKLILCGFHEATLMCQSVYNRINPGKRYVLKYTTVSGVDGFDGTRKEAEKAVVKSID